MPLLVGFTTQDSSGTGTNRVNFSAETVQEFNALKHKFNNLNKSLIALGGITDESHTSIENLRQQFSSFNGQHPKHRSGIAHELQLAIWLNNNEVIDSLFSKLIDIADQPQSIRTAWAITHKKRNNYQRAIQILEADPYDPAKNPRAGLVYSDCLFAENRFQESVDVLEAIPSGAMLANQQLLLLGGQVATALTKRESIVELWKEEEVIRATELVTDDLPRVELITDKGRIVVELFENEAPNTVANFISLVEFGFYDLSKFHRVIPDFMSQGGDPNTKPGGEGEPGQGGPGYRIPDEFVREGSRKHFTGSLSMAKTAVPDSGGSQFFLTHNPTVDLNGKHTVFGRILEGLDVARNLEIDDVLRSAKVLRKRDHEYSPETLPEFSGSSRGSSLGLPPTNPK